MPKQFFINKFIKGVNVLYPSQINIINGPVECLSALFLNNSRELTLEELHHMHIYMKDIYNVSVHLNIQVMFSPEENESKYDHQ